jgi:hypothetical protein
MSGKDCVISWDEFSKAVSERFGSKKDLMEEYFNKLLQEIGIHEYVERFEKLKSLMSASNPFFLESYYISSFINGRYHTNAKNS